MEEKLDIYQRVAQFLINVRTKKPREAICNALVVSILVDEERPLGVNQVVKKIEEKWRIRTPPERISKSLKSLHGFRVLQKDERLYYMRDQQKEDYRQMVRNRAAFFEAVEQDWLDSMQKIRACRELTADESGLIIKDFRSAMSRLCEREGDKIRKFLDRSATELEYTVVGREIIACLPSTDSRPSEILKIEKRIFPLFFDSGDLRRAQYVTGLAQACLRETIFEVETKGFSIFEAKMQSLNVYLDTMLVFRLLGLDGREKQEIAEHFISMHRNLGINTLVDERSIQEFRSVLDNSRRLKIGMRIPKGIFVEVQKAILEPGYEPKTRFALPDDPFTLAFWASLDVNFANTAKRKDIMFEWERFLNHYESVDIVLSTKYKVKIVKTSQHCIPEESTFEEIKDRLVKAAKTHNIRKTPSTIEHDALMFCMVKKLRESETPELFPSNYWLLSADKSLGTFHKSLPREDGRVLAHFVPVTSWIELIMPFLTIQLVDEQEDAVLITKSLGEGFEHFEVDRMSPREMALVLNRVPESYEQGPELVLRCAGHRHFRETIKSAVSDKKIGDKDVDEAIIKAIESAKDQIELDNKALITELRKNRDGLTKEVAARESAEERLRKKEQLLRRIKLGVILPIPAGLISFVAYMLTSPQFHTISINTAFWMIGILYLCWWIWFSVSRTTITPRCMVCTFLVSPLVLMVPLFFIHSGNMRTLPILVGVFVAVLGYLVYLLKTSWLDIRIMLR